MNEFRDRGDQPADRAERTGGQDAPGRYVDERRGIRVVMDRAVKDPAFALSREQDAELKRAWAMSPNEAAGYKPPTRADVAWMNRERDRGVDAYRTALDTELPGPDGGKSPRASMRDMPGVTEIEANRYLDRTDFDERPWLRATYDATTDARRVIATIDQAEGHYLQRHEGVASGEAARDRVERLHDPANPDDGSRLRAEDAFKTALDGGPRRHSCGHEATAIADPDAFAAAVARTHERGDVRAALDRTYDPDVIPAAMEIPIAEVLGPRGHETCEGYRLTPIDGSADKAMQNRAEWVKAQRDGTPTNAVAPRSEKIDSFAGGVLVVMFQERTDHTGYAIKTMYPKPAGS